VKLADWLVDFQCIQEVEMKQSTLIPWELLLIVLAVATVHAAQPPMNWWDNAIARNDQRLLNDGRQIFR
jgi:hypothetical protein